MRGRLGVKIIFESLPTPKLKCTYTASYQIYIDAYRIRSANQFGF